MRNIIRNWKPRKSRYTKTSKRNFNINGVKVYWPQKYSIAHFRNLFHMGLLEQYAFLEIKTGYTDHFDDHEYLSILNGDNDDPRNVFIF